MMPPKSHVSSVKNLIEYPKDFVKIYGSIESTHDQIPKIQGGKLLASDNSNSYHCFITDILNNLEKTMEIRQFIKSTYENAEYEGFSNTVDRYYDDYGKHLAIRDNNHNIISVARLIHKTKNNLLSFEMGIVQDSPKRRYVIENENILDLNSFCFRNLRTVNLLFGCLARYCVLNKIERVFTLYDLDSKSFYRYYQKIGWELSLEYERPIYFPGYGKTINGQFVPALWGVMEMSKSTILSIEKKLSTAKVYI